MMWVPKEEAAIRLGVSTDTVERKLKRGELNGRKEPRPRGWRWLVEVPDVASAEDTAASAEDTAYASADSANSPQLLREMVDFLKEELKTRELSWKQQVEAKDEQIRELHVLLQQAQAALPAPRDDRPWWRRILQRSERG